MLWGGGGANGKLYRILVLATGAPKRATCFWQLSLFCNVQNWSVLATRSAVPAIGGYHGLYWLHWSGIWHRSVWHISTNVADELGSSVFWEGKAVALHSLPGYDALQFGKLTSLQMATFICSLLSVWRQLQIPVSVLCLLQAHFLALSISHALRLLVPFQLFTTLLNRFTVCRRPQYPCRAELTNLWHAYPKWRAEIFPWHAAFTAVPIFFCWPTNVCILWRICLYIYTHIWRRRDCIWITVATKLHCEWNVFTQICSGAKC